MHRTISPGVAFTPEEMEYDILCGGIQTSMIYPIIREKKGFRLKGLEYLAEKADGGYIRGVLTTTKGSSESHSRSTVYYSHETIRDYFRLRKKGSHVSAPVINEILFIRGERVDPTDPRWPVLTRDNVIGLLVDQDSSHDNVVVFDVLHRSTLGEVISIFEEFYKDESHLYQL